MALDGRRVAATTALRVAQGLRGALRAIPEQGVDHHGDDDHYHEAGDQPLQDISKHRALSWWSAASSRGGVGMRQEVLPHPDRCLADPHRGGSAMADPAPVRDIITS